MYTLNIFCKYTFKTVTIILWKSDNLVSIWQVFRNLRLVIQPAFTCLKLTIETLEQGMKYVQS